MNRRSAMLMTGVGLLAAATRVPPALGSPMTPQAPAPEAPAGGTGGNYIFADDFDGPAGQGPDPAKWAVQTWQDDTWPPVEGQYRAQNVFLDGHSNLVLLASKEGDRFFSGKVRGTWRGLIGTTWEARIKLDCLFPGLWPAFWAVNEDPDPDGEVDIVEWYGNGDWPPGTTVHAASNGKTWQGKSIPGLVDGAWHTWRMHWSDKGFQFSRDGVPYFSVPPKPIPMHDNPADLRWPFNIPGYWLSPMFTLAIGGPGGGNPDFGTFPSQMLIDYIRVW